MIVRGNVNGVQTKKGLEEMVTQPAFGQKPLQKAIVPVIPQVGTTYQHKVVPP